MSIDRHATLVTNGGEQHQDSITVFDVALENSYQVCEWAIADDHLIAALQIVIELNEPVFANARFDQLNHFVFHGDWTIAKPDYLTNSASEPYLSQHAARFEACEQVARKQ
jgi:hypothetical protein